MEQNVLEMMPEVLDGIENVDSIFLSVVQILGFLASAVSAVVGVASAVVAVVSAIVAFVVFVVLHILKAIPIYNLAKKTNTKYAWLVWIPFFGTYFRTYILCTMAGDKEVKLFDGHIFFKEGKIPEFFDKKLVIKDRKLSFWIYLAVDLLGNGVITVIVGILQFIPVLGQIAGLLVSVLYLLPSAIILVFDYVYLRDVLHIFDENKKNNNIIAIIISALDTFATAGLARTVYLFTLMKKQPIDSVLEVEAVEVE